MRRLSNPVVRAILGSALLIPATATADEVHSWCVTGPALVSPSTASNPATAEIINAVCAVPNLRHCCHQLTGGWWDLGCVQEAASIAKRNGYGDVCGRDAWAQGPMAGTQQYYPRDFGLFALGNASDLRDSEGPVAAQGNVQAVSFNLNWGQKAPVGVVADARLSLVNGQVVGTAAYGTTYSGTSVTYRTASPPTASSHPIDFAAAGSKLRDMSLAIKAYPSVTVSRVYNAITFRGTDLELNVFTVDASQLTETTSYVFDVPTDSSVIINVTGSSPMIRYAGFDRRNGLSANSILWNFPDATKLRMTSVGLPGSVLAPLADASFQYGNVAGTVVVKSAAGPEWFELHQATYSVPSFTCGIPDFEPALWNDSAVRSDNNCYNYANNVFLWDYGEPGRASGEYCDRTVDPACQTPENYARYAQNDGLIPTTATATCPDKRTKVALFFVQNMSGTDYHWWRLDRDGTWSEKSGGFAATKTAIPTPGQVTDRLLVGYFCTCASRIQGAGHANIR